jgi:hypothetical protein
MPISQPITWHGIMMVRAIPSYKAELKAELMDLGAFIRLPLYLPRSYHGMVSDQAIMESISKL